MTNVSFDTGLLIFVTDVPLLVSDNTHNKFIQKSSDPFSIAPHLFQLLQSTHAKEQDYTTKFLPTYFLFGEVKYFKDYKQLPNKA